MTADPLVSTDSNRILAASTKRVAFYALKAPVALEMVSTYY
jgi:hypothetical protein